MQTSADETAASETSASYWGTGTSSVVSTSADETSASETAASQSSSAALGESGADSTSHKPISELWTQRATNLEVDGLNEPSSRPSADLSLRDRNLRDLSLCFFFFA